MTIHIGWLHFSCFVVVPPASPACPASSRIRTRVCFILRHWHYFCGSSGSTRILSAFSSSISSITARTTTTTSSSELCNLNVQCVFVIVAPTAPTGGHGPATTIIISGIATTPIVVTKDSKVEPVALRHRL